MTKQRTPGDMMLRALDVSPLAAAPPPLYGYLSVTVWDWEKERKQLNVDDAITSYGMKWRVPSPPKDEAEQAIFLFNGIQPSTTNPNKAVLQPVLQWGNGGPVDGGRFWSVSSWYVRGQPGALDIATRTRAIRVEPGQELAAQISLTGTSEGIFSYVCEFVGIPGSTLVVRVPTELVRLTTALEGYDIFGEAQLPASAMTSFHDIDIRAGAKRLNPKWDVRNLAPPETGISASVVVNGGFADQVDITYR